MSYHLSGSLGAQVPINPWLKRHQIQMHPQVQRVRYFGGIGGYGGAGGLGDDVKKGALALQKAIAMNALTPKEVATVNAAWAKYDNDMNSLTTGKKKISTAKALGILGPRPTIEKIVGHPLVAGAGLPGAVPGALPGSSPPPGGGSSTSSSEGPPWGLIAGGAALLVVGYFATQG